MFRVRASFPSRPFLAGLLGRKTETAGEHFTPGTGKKAGPVHEEPFTTPASTN